MASSLMTNEHLNWLIQKAFGGSGSITTTTETYPNKWEVGIDNTTPSVSDASLTARVPYTSTNLDDCDTADWVHGGDGQQEVLNTSGENEGTGCLNIPITYSTGTSSWYKAMASTSNLSATGTGMYVWLYVDDLTNVASGSDGVSVIITDENATFTDFSQFDFNKSDLIAGEWNTLRITSLGSPDSQGVNEADLTAIKTIKLQVKTTGNYASDSLRMDAFHFATLAQHQKASESSYPVMNSNLHTITDLVKYNSAQANGYKIQEVGWKNSDDTLHNHGIFTYINKDSGKELRVMTIAKFENA